MNPRTRIAGTVVAVGLAAILAITSACGGNTEVVNLKGEVVKLESVSGFYNITARTQDGKERTFTIDEQKWGEDKSYKALKSNLDVGDCIELPGINRDVVSSQMYVGPDLVKIVECE